MVQHTADVPATVGRLDRIGVEFNEKRLISDAGLLLTATLADRLGVQELVSESVWLPYGTPGAALPGRKVMTLVHGMIAGADSIDDMDLLRAGSTQAVLGHRVMAPSTLGTFLRAFSFGHVRQLDHVLDELIGRAWAAGTGPGDGPLVIDLDSFVGEVYGYEKEGAGYGYTHKYGYHPLVATRADTGEVLHIRLRKGSANTQRGVERFVDELLARVARAGHHGQIIIRADIGFENHKLMRALHKRGVLFSIGAKQSAKVKALISEIPENAWIPVIGYPDRGEAQVAEVLYGDWRLIVRRTRLTDPSQLELWPDAARADTVVVTAEPAGDIALARLLMLALGLTPGERSVCERVLTGASTNLIAAGLQLSPYTVQDRLKSIFAKAQVGSRGELVARLMTA